MALTGSVLGSATRAELETLLVGFVDDDANWRFSTCVTHGDIGPPHVLVDEDGNLAGVIDWGDMEVGDPANDLAWVLGAMPKVGERALTAYGGEPDARFRLRADAGFRLMPWSDIDYGVRIGNEVILQRGLDGLHDRLA